MKKILCLDLARKCGWAYIESYCTKHIDLPLVKKCGMVDIGAHTIKRWINLQVQISALINEYKPELLIIEKNFIAKNIKTTAALNQLLGVVLLLAAQKSVKVDYVDNNSAKKTMLGTTRYWDSNLNKYVAVTKDMMLEAVKRTICTCSDIPKEDDAADAIALAWSYWNCPTTVIPLPRKPVVAKVKKIRKKKI